VRTIDLLPAAYGVGVITMFVNENSRRLGDLAAGTVVVHETKSAALNELTSYRQNALATVIASGLMPAGFPLGRLSNQDVNMIEDFLMRRARLANRRQLARHILRSLSERLGQPIEPSSMEDAENVLAAIYQAIKKRNAE
jgi:hypothetical protein